MYITGLLLVAWKAVAGRLAPGCLAAGNSLYVALSVFEAASAKEFAQQ